MSAQPSNTTELAAYRLSLINLLDKHCWQVCTDAFPDPHWVEARHPSSCSSYWFPVLQHPHYLTILSGLLSLLHGCYWSGVTEGRTQAFGEVSELLDRFKQLMGESRQ